MHFMAEETEPRVPHAITLQVKLPPELRQLR